MVHFSFLCDDGSIYHSGTKLQTYSGLRCYSYKQFNKGTWYAEITHFSGDNAHLFGISQTCGKIIFYPEKKTETPYLYTDGCFSDNREKNRTTLSFTLQQNHVIGISVNFDRRLFSIFYNNSFDTFTYHNYQNDDYSFQFLVGGGTVDDSNDLIEVNTGETTFNYNISSSPLLSSLYDITINKPNYNIVFSFLFMIFIPK